MPRPGEVVYYRQHPDPDKIDRFCGAGDRSWVVRHVAVPKGESSVLTLALEALFEHLGLPPSQLKEVDVSEGKATIDLRSFKHLGFATTSCGGVVFMGSLLRTTFQFDSVRSLQIEVGGSCERFGILTQSGRCDTFTRADL